MQYKLNITLYILNSIIVAPEELNISKINVIILLIIFFYADVHIILIDNLYISHVFIDDILVDFSNLLA